MKFVLRLFESNHDIGLSSLHFRTRPINVLNGYLNKITKPLMPNKGIKSFNFYLAITFFVCYNTKTSDDTTNFTR